MIDRILVFRLGSLGDTLVALPALWAVRDAYRHAHIALLCNQYVSSRRVTPQHVLEGAGVIDEFLTYHVDDSWLGRALRPLRMLRLALQLRLRKFDALVYLPPTHRTPAQIRRDRRFFRLIGFQHLIGLDRRLTVAASPAHPLPPVRLECEETMSWLEDSPVAIPPAGHWKMDLRLGAQEEAAVKAWLDRLPDDGGRPWIAVGPGSKMPAKVWPETRYLEVVGNLIAKFDVWPTVFSGPEDGALGDRMIAAWKRGYNAAGSLPPRPAAAALRRCRLYLGNDTGTMHLAATVGIRCVAIFSARDFPGRWDPYGDGHVVLRKAVPCEGCMLETCIDRKMECLLSISTDEVQSTCESILQTHARGPLIASLQANQGSSPPVGR